MTALVALPTHFYVRIEVFQGSLPELGTALRTGQILPNDVPLLQLTHDVLAWIQISNTEASPQYQIPDTISFIDCHPDLLPALANVIALKTRLLLPQPTEEEKAEVPEDEALDELIESVETLAELDHLVAFLSIRRQDRISLIPANPIPLKLPRKEHPHHPQRSLDKLIKAAKQAVRQINTPLLSRERLTLADALYSLRELGRNLKSFSFWSITTAHWSDRTTYFAALLEGIKEGSFTVQQDDTFGKIEVYIVQDITNGPES